MKIETTVVRQTVETTENNFDVQVTQNVQTVETLTGVLNVTQSLDAHYEHIQALASTTWVINHGLGKYPSVTIVDSGGNTWITDIEYNSVNQCTARFKAAFGGKAYCN